MKENMLFVGDNHLFNEDWDMEYDVVSVGFGPAGASVARAAQENDASCIIIEKEDEKHAGGSAAVSMGYIASYTPELIESSSRGKLNHEQAKLIQEKMEESLSWLEEHGLKINNNVAEGFGPGFYEAVKNAAGSLDIPIMYNTKAMDLIYDPLTKEVVGVQCKDENKNLINIKANKGVVLATGGFMANKDLVNRLLIPTGTNMALAGAPSQTGDGLMMAMDLNASLDGLNLLNVEWYGLAFRKASEELGTAILHIMDNIDTPSRIFFNEDGERFMNEELNIVHYKGQLPFLEYNGDFFEGYDGYKNLPMYVIFDSKMAESGPVGPNNYNCGYATFKEIYDEWSEDNQTEVEKGWLVSADTLEGLIQKLNPKIDKKNLEQTIEHYNRITEKRVDTDFGRPSDTLSPIEEGPFYAAELVPSPVYTIGGLQGGPQGETLNWNAEPIPRLFHAGDIGQPVDEMVLSLPGAMALGYLAGKAVSKLE